ncbi:hypothetical protein C1H46_000539 [Malus baccata]|uniref:Uncharacterized protein n=1 Tax=Malus baccata TaxID=106549 RepID=A0A540NS86_MALBA|nr:hypothetical protein C1H46_000539 [Malus baccata]
MYLRSRHQQQPLLKILRDIGIIPHYIALHVEITQQPPPPVLYRDTREMCPWRYLEVKPFSERVLTRESGTFLLSCLRISEGFADPKAHCEPTDVDILFSLYFRKGTRPENLLLNRFKKVTWIWIHDSINKLGCWIQRRMRKHEPPRLMCWFQNMVQEAAPFLLLERRLTVQQLDEVNEKENL